MRGIRVQCLVAVTGILLGLVPWARAEAQFVIKRVKCTDLVQVGTAYHVYRNLSANDRTVTIQVVRNGCRPKGGSFRLWRFNGSTWTLLADMPLDEYGTTVDISPGSYLSMTYLPTSTARVGGVLEFSYAVE